MTSEPAQFDLCFFKTDSPLYKECLDIRFEEFVNEQKVSKDVELENEEDSLHFILKQNGEPVCTARLRPVPKKKILKFERIACLKKFRGTGLSKKLMLFVQQYAFEHYPELGPLMSAQLSAKGFYEKLGWSKLPGEIYMDAGMEHIDMHLSH